MKTKLNSVLKNLVNSILFIWVFFLIFSINILKADVYFSAGVSKLKNDNLELNMLSNKGVIYPNFSTSSQTSYTTGDIIQTIEVTFTDITTTNNYSLVNNSAKVVLKPEGDSLSPNLGYNFSLGYRLFNKLRIEGEYRSVNMGAQAGNLLTNLNVNTDIHTVSVSESTPGEGYTGSVVIYDEHNTYNGYVENANLLSLIQENADGLQYIKSTSKANYYFLNVLYDISLGKYFGVFTGAGIGMGKLTVSTKLSNGLQNLSVNLSGSSSFSAYQYKIGVYLQPIEYLRFSVGLNQINSLGEVSFNEGKFNKITQNSADFLITILTNIW